MKSIPLFLLSLFLLVLYANGQNLELSLQTGSISVGSSSKKFGLDLDTYTQQDDYSTTDKSYTFNLISDFRKDTFKIYRLLFGFKRYSLLGHSTSQTSVGNHFSTSADVKSNTANFAFGYGKIVPLQFSNQSFVVKYGVYFPLSMTFGETDIRTFDLLRIGIDTTLEKKETVEPNTYRVGVGMFSGVNYNFFKKLWVGFEMQNNLIFTYQKGESELTITRFDPVSKDQVIDQESQTEEIQVNRLSTSLLNLSLNLTYRF